MHAAPDRKSQLQQKQNRRKRHELWPQTQQTEGGQFLMLRSHNIPTRSYYAEAELDTAAAQERFALLKVLLNNEDRVALRWLLGCGHIDWRSAPYARLLRRVRDDGTSPWITLERLAAGPALSPHRVMVHRVCRPRRPRVRWSGFYRSFIRRKRH